MSSLENLCRSSFGSFSQSFSGNSSTNRSRISPGVPSLTSPDVPSKIFPRVPLGIPLYVPLATSPGGPLENASQVVFIWKFPEFSSRIYPGIFFFLEYLQEFFKKSEFHWQFLLNYRQKFCYESFNNFFVFFFQ